MYTVLDNKLNDFNIIEITDGRFKGCKFVFGEIKFADEPNDDGTYTVSFDYVLAEEYHVTDAEEFKTVLGDIMVSLLEVAADESMLLMKGGV